MRLKRSASSEIDDSESTALGLTGLVPRAPILVGWAVYASDGTEQRLDESRRIKPLPRRPPPRQIIGRGLPPARDRKTSAFMQYRSVSNTTVSSDDLSEALDPSEDETATTLSDVESEILASILQSHSTRDHTPINNPDDEEGDEIDLALVATPKSHRARSKSYSPPTPRASSSTTSTTSTTYRADVKGKAVDPREHHLHLRGKRQRPKEDTGSGSEGDDEGANEHPVPYKKKRAHRPTPLALAKTNLGPTRSILDITMGIDCLGESEVDVEYSSEDLDDARLVSASLMSHDEPMPLVSDTTEHVDKVTRNRNRALCRHDAKADLYSDLQAEPRRPAQRQYLRAPSGSSSSDEEKMITSDIEREMAAIDNAVQRRKRCRDFPARLPGQNTSAKLRRISPTSLLPMREKRRHLRTNRLFTNHPLSPRHPIVGQVMLATLREAKESREKRRTAVKRANAKFLFANTALLPAFEYQPPVVVRPATPEPNGFDWTAYQLEVIRRKRQYRDRRRIEADRKISQHNNFTPVRAAAPVISPSFAPLSFCSPALAAVEDEVGGEETGSPMEIEIEIEEQIDHQIDEHHSVQELVDEPTSPTVSEPPEYEEPPMPITLPLPPHLRPRPPPRAVGTEVPAYPWLSHLSGGEYTRLSPPPPPPFNAQTDAETVIPARFIDSDDEDDGMFERILPGGLRDDNGFNMVGAFPTPSAPSGPSAPSSMRGSSPTILSPTPVRWMPTSPLANMRTPWEAALDMEEGEEDEDIIEDVFEADDEDEVEAEQALEQSSSALSAFGRLLGRVWRW